MTPLGFYNPLTLMIAGVLVVADPVDGQADDPMVKPEPQSVLLKGWTAETFKLPPAFAPELPTGHEALRFAPGWRDPKAEDFWSYAFVMWIDEPAPDTARMKELLEKYYDGLLGSFAVGKKKDISKTPARVEVVHTATNNFEMKMHVIDAFATFNPIDLRVVVDCHPRAAESSVLHIQVSPKPKEHAIWKSLDVAIASIVSQDGASQKKESHKVAHPMAAFARMVGGEWKVTAASGSSMYDTWHWGPGKHSMRVTTHGLDAAGKPWRELEIFYWHPGRKKVCLFGLSPFAAGVSEGWIKFESGAADAVFDLYQTEGRRKMGLRWDFDGSDKYHEKLMEAIGSGDLRPLAEWDHVRNRSPEPRARATQEPPKLSDRLKAFEPLLGRTWNTRGTWATKGAFHIETTFEWVPLANAIYARTFALRGNGSPMHVLDAYFYHHTGSDRLRCLALATWGDWKDWGDWGEGISCVYEGDVSVLEGGALQLDLKGYEGDLGVSYVVRFDFEKDGALHDRIWSLDGAKRTLMLDVHHSASEMSKSIISVFQDKKNNYWFGSDVQGVYRYDGKAISHFQTTDGLAHDRVRGIQEDKSGNLYFTTANGISKFDGNSFSTLIPVRSDPPDKEWNLAPDDLWFPGAQDAGEVSRYDGKVLHGLVFPRTKLGDEFHAKYPRSKYPNMNDGPYTVYSIFKDSKGHIWFGGGTGIGALGACRYDGKSFTWISSDEIGFGDIAYCVRSIAEDKDGKFWFSSTKHRFDMLEKDASGRENPANYRKEKGVSHSEDDFPFFMSSIKDHNGDLWMASFGAGVWRYDGKKVIQYPVHDNGRPVTLFSIYKDNQGDLWLGSHEAGAYKFNGKSFEKFKIPEKPGQLARSDLTKAPKDELNVNTLDNEGVGVRALEPLDEPVNPDPFFTPTGTNTTSTMPRVIIRNMREDRAGNIWFATFGGPIRYDGKVFTNFSEEVGLANRRIFSLLEDRSGSLWFGSITSGATRYDGKVFTKFTVENGLASNVVNWIFEDRDANIWFGTEKGVSRYNDKSMTNFTTKDGLVHNSVYAIAQDASGQLWFGTQGGICSYDGKSFSILADNVGRPFVNIRSIVVDRSGNVWFGGQEGAFRYDGKIVTAFNSKSGLLDDFVGSMIVDRAGNLWLGHPGSFPAGSGGGATRFDGKSFKHFTHRDGLGSQTVYSMLEDNAGNIWFGSADAGACRYDGKTFTQFSEIDPPTSPSQGSKPNDGRR